jgi:large subunit ribosomal protein L23
VSNVYAFEVHEDATKRQVAEAVEEAYSKKPVKVNIVSMPGKPTSARFKGRPGKKGKMKKAYVYLKKGDTLQLI